MYWLQIQMVKEFHRLFLLHGQWKTLPHMPGPAKTEFKFLPIDGKLLVKASLVEDDCSTARASADIPIWLSLNRVTPIAFLNCLNLNGAFRYNTKEVLCVVSQYLILDCLSSAYVHCKPIADICHSSLFKPFGQFLCLSIQLVVLLTN